MRFLSTVCKVGKKPRPLAEVSGSDGTSRNIKRLDFVALSFQVSTHFSENQIGDVRHVFTQDPSWLALGYDSKHLRPEVARVVFGAAFSGDAERLARESSRDEITSDSGNISDIAVVWHFGPVAFEDGVCIGFDF